MPTKPNRAGQQQNYVPKGNGDASGEYGDNATGSNKHFTNFAKPKDEEIKVEETKVEQPKESKYLGGSEQKTNFYLSLITSGITNSKNVLPENREDFTKNLKEVVGNANEDSINILYSAFNQHPVEFIEDKHNAKSSYYYPAMRQIHIDPNIFDNRGFEKKGSSMFHELGHYLNDAYKIREKEKWYFENRKLTDAYSIFDDNISIADTLQEEIKEFSANGYPPKIRKEKSKFVNERLKQYGFTDKEYERLTDNAKQALKSEEWQNIKNSVVSDFNNGRFENVAKANEYLKEQLNIWKKNGSYKDLFSEIDSKRPYYSDACNEWYKATGINAVSDVWSSKSDFGFGLGHDRQYYSKKPYGGDEPKSMVADELFANFYAAFTTNEKATLETTKKYFPRTYDKMLKLVDYLKGKQKEKLGE